VGLAHNDLAGNMIPPYTPQELVNLLDEHEIFVELSTDPETDYYRQENEVHRQVWQALADSGVEFSVGSDMHGEIDRVVDLADAHAYLEERGLIDRLITRRWDPELHMWRRRSNSKDDRNSR
jgi:histidinol phosphatase-like PHP family hydrolase